MSILRPTKPSYRITTCASNLHDYRDLEQQINDAIGEDEELVSSGITEYQYSMRAVLVIKRADRVVVRTP